MPTATRIDRTFSALADPTRRRLVERLSAGPCSVRELADPLPITLSAVLQHVQVLEDTGLVSTRKSGRVRTCTLRHDGLTAAEQWLADQRVTWAARLDRLGGTLDQLAEREGPGA